MAAPSGRPPSTSIFIGNVGFSATEEELSAIFKQAGPVKSFRLVSDRETGKTKGYAFAEYFDIPTAQSAQRNLNGADFNGRSLRVDFADNDKYGPESRGPHKPAVVGKEAVNAAGQTMAAALGGGGGGAGQQQISDALAKMTRAQIFEILSQMKALIQQNPAQARQILVQNPQLTKALFQAQILLGMVSPPPAANGIQASAQQPAPMQMQPPAMQQQVGQQFPQQPGMPFQPPFQAGPQQAVPQQQPPQQQQQHSQPPLLQTLPRPQTLAAPMQQGGPRPFSGAPAQQQAPPRPQAMPAAMPQVGGFPGQMLPQQPQLATRPTDGRQPVPFDPRQQGLPQQRPPVDPRHQAPHDPRQQQHGPIDPRQQDPRLHAPADPRQQSAADPRQQAPLDPRQQMPGSGMPQQSPGPAMMGFGQQQGPPAMPLAQPGLGPDQQQALLRQVMSLTPQQIEMLPEAQRQQVLDLQRQLRGQVGMMS